MIHKFLIIPAHTTAINNAYIPLLQIIQFKELSLATVHVKKTTLVGAFAFQILLEGKESSQPEVRTL